MDLARRLSRLSPQQRKLLELKLRQQGIDAARSPFSKTSEIRERGKIEPAEEREYYPLASTQRRLFMIQHMYHHDPGYNMPCVMRLQGEVIQNKFEGALKKIIARHESLRTSFEFFREEPVQRIHEEVEFEIEYYDLAAGAGVTPGQLPTDFFRAFDLSHAPLLRVGLKKINENHYLFLVDMHHIISDGVSLNLFIKEFIGLYGGNKLPVLPIQYKDFCLWQNKILTTGKLEKQEAYWLEQFSGELPTLNMPLDYERPSAQCFEGNAINFRLPGELSQTLYALMKETGTTLFMVILALYHVLFHKYTGQEDIIIGTATAGRNYKALETIMGLFMETLVFRNFPEGHKTFASFLKEVKETVLDAFENQAYPFRELMKRVADENDLSHNPLFDAMLIVHNLERARLETGGLQLSLYEFEPHQAKVDINLLVSEDEDGILFNLRYGTALFKPAAMERFVRHFMNLIGAAVADSRVQLAEIDIMDEEEKQRILQEFSTTLFDYDRSKSLPELFAGIVKKIPDHPAVVTEIRQSGINCAVTYNELNQRADGLAGILRQRGVKPGDIVGIMTEPSDKMIVGLIGILKAGGAFLPMDPGIPKERVRYLLQDCNARVLVSELSDVSKVSEGTEVVKLSELNEEFPTHLTNPIHLTHLTHPTHLCYIIYTSGSTGKPKGVAVDQENLLPLFFWFRDYFRLDENTRVIRNLSYVFDFGVFEIFTTVFFGGIYYLHGRNLLADLEGYVDYIERHCINTFHTTPTLFNYIVSLGKKLPGLGIVHFGGEILRGKLVRDTAELVSPGCMIYNGYGPTEATINSSIFSIKAGEAGRLADNDRIPIGKPSANNIYYILDIGSRRKLQSIGIVGELCIAGEGLARGYLNRPELTAERFINILEQASLFPTPYSPTHPLTHLTIYRTGDLARWLDDGNVEFLGRIDHQIKIRGFRVELGEIENQLLRQVDIKEAVVLDKEDKNGNKYLCAYIVPAVLNRPKDVFVTELRVCLSGKLPAYMVPANFIVLDRIPLTPSGKVDMKALHSYDSEENIVIGTTYEAPSTEAEKKLAEIWSEILLKKRIGIYDNFFELGGQSLSAMKAISMIKEVFNVKIPLMIFFQRGTIREIAEVILDLQSKKKDSFEESFKRKGLTQPFEVDKSPLHTSPQEAEDNLLSSVELIRVKRKPRKV